MKTLFMNLTLARKLILVLLMSGLIPLIIASLLTSTIASQQLEKQAFAQLSAVREIKGAAIKRYFDEVSSQAITLANDPAVIEAARDFSFSYPKVSSDEQFTAQDTAYHVEALQAFYTEQFEKKFRKDIPKANIDTARMIDKLSPAAITLQYMYIADNPNPLGEKDKLTSHEGAGAYHQTHRKYHGRFREFITEFGYYDFFIVDAESGNIIYSVFKEIDFATSLKRGPYAQTNIAASFQNALTLPPGQTALLDFESYRPSYDAPASFISAPIYNNEQITAVLILQIPLEPINEIMGNRAGMGESGESYLAGSDYLMRSDSYNNPQQFSVVASFRNPDQGKVETLAVKQALEGRSGADILLNYDGHRVLSAYAPLEFHGLSWVIIAEIVAAEAFAGITGLKWLMLLFVIVGAVAIALFAFYISKLIASPILKLSQAIQRVEQEGNFDLRLSTNTNEEIGHTSRAFNNLLKKLGNAILSTNRVLESLQRGDFNAHIGEQFNGQLSVLTNGVNAAVDQIKIANKEQSRQQKNAEVSARLAEDAAEKANLQAREILIIKQALDVSATGVMIADTDFNIIYTNNSLNHLMRDAADDIKQEISGFNPEKMIGANIDSFHKHPEHQRKLLRELRGNHTTQLKIGTLDFHLSATPIRTDDGEFLGAVVEWENITERLQKEKSDRKISEENARIRQALDSSSTGTMIANADHKIIYTNHALDGILSALDRNGQQLSVFNELTQLLAHCIGTEKTSPSEQQTLLTNLNQTLETEFVMGLNTCMITLNPVHNNDGTRIGTVVEWLDRTAEVAVEREIDTIVHAAAAGDFSGTVDIRNKNGFFLKVSDGLNTLLTTTNGAVRELAALFSALAKGDLSRTIEREYEGDFARLKQDANTTVEKLRDVIDGISSAASDIARGSKEISEGNLDLSKRTEEQAAALEETASSMEEMMSVVQQSEHNALTANKLASSSVETARQGDLSVRKTAEAMSQIAQSSDKIASIIGVIDEIAFQTNLLALNAAVEAARAGEQGRGFAVVAGEVRNLAQRSASAAREIKDLIRDSVSKVNDGSALVELSGKTLQSIVQEIERVGHAMSHISESAREQSEGISRVNQAISHMDEMTQQNVALVEEASATSANMADLAHQLDGMVAFFKK